jgi:transcriptional regulator with XRE-family HTH domain
MDAMAARPAKPASTKKYSGRVGARIRVLRTDRDWTVEDLCHRLRDVGLARSVNSIRSWEAGRRILHPDDYPFVAKAFGVTIHELLPAK